MMNFTHSVRGSAVLLLSFAAACTAGGKKDTADSADSATPMILATAPVDGEADVAVNRHVGATFSEEMDPSTLTGATFTVTTGTPAAAIEGTIIYADSAVSFWPTERFASETTFTATITTGAESAMGIALAEDHSWSFTTGDTLAPNLSVNVGAAGDFAILAKSAISTVPASDITGNIGVSPAAASFITGFSLTSDATDTFATSPQVTGRVYASDYAPPTPSNLTIAVGAMELAFTDAAGRAPDVNELGAGSIGGATLTAGTYRWSTGLEIATDVTLSGSATDVWILQIAQDLVVSSAARVVLTGGALPENVFWQVAGLVEIGTTAHVEGTILTKTSAAMRTGSTLNGRLLAQTAVDIDQSTIVAP